MDAVGTIKETADFEAEVAVLLKELRAVVEVPAGKMYKVTLSLDEGDFVWWKFRGFNFFMSGDIGFKIEKKVATQSEDDDGQELPWKGSNESCRYDAANPVEGLWGPALMRASSTSTLPCMAAM